MKKINLKIVAQVLFAFLVVSISLNIILFNSGKNLNEQIEKRDSLLSEKDYTYSSIITNMKISDSLYRSYITQGAISYDGVSIDIDQLLNILRTQLTENFVCHDSLSQYKSLLKKLDNLYGRNFNVYTKNNLIYTVKLFNKADSALLLYPYYKDKIFVDENGNFNIYGPSELIKTKDGKMVNQVQQHTIIFQNDTIKEK